MKIYAIHLMASTHAKTHTHLLITMAGLEDL